MTLKRLFVLIPVGAACMAALGGCIKDKGYGPIRKDKVPIVLTQANVHQPTRGVSVPDGRLANDSTFNVTAYYYPGGAAPFSGTTMYWDGYSQVGGNNVKTNEQPMLNVPYKVVSGSFVSQASSQYYWPEGPNDKLRFFAYMPQQSKIHSTAELQPAPSHAVALDETWTLRYKLPDEVVNHHDLLIAVTGLKDANDETALNFNHTLTQIDFKVRRSDDFAPDTKVVIEKIVIHDVLRHGLLTVDPNSGSPFTWKQHNSNAELCDLTLSSTGENAVMPEDFDLNSSHRSLMRGDSNGSHYIMAIPMNTGEMRSRFDDAFIEVTAKIDGNERTFELPLAGTDPWAPDKKVTYLFTVNPAGIGWDYLVEDWVGPFEIGPEISNAILEVSRTTATINEHVKARIWFKTNQPEVKLETSAIDGIIPIVDWDYVTDDLTGDNPRNFQYWWDEEIGYTVGYVDIETDRSKPSVGSTGHFGTFFINAGGLRREITIYWENVPNEYMQNWEDYPYVGAFWRHDEVGERLISGRLGGNYSWTATVTYGDFIVLEKGKTLDEKVWTDQESGDAENYPVEGVATEIVGEGNIYFRIGLTGNIPSGEVRYGIVTVTVTNPSSVTKTYNIYVRQGEAADYVSDPEYLFSPYNVTSPYPLGPGTYLDLGPHGGVFTKFPTQGGSFFQRNRTVAYSREGEIQNIENLYPKDRYPQPWNKDLEVCPPGYRTPEKAAHEYWGPSVEAGDGVLVPGKNVQSGYYADGYFDRYIIVNTPLSPYPQNSSYMPLKTRTNDAFSGELFYNNDNRRSIFFPRAGQREYLPEWEGVFSRYWASDYNEESNENTTVALYSSFVYYFGLTGTSNEKGRFCLSVRCVKE